MSTTFASFGVTVAWDVAAFLGCLTVFNVLRRTPYTQKIYAPKRFMEQEKYAYPKELPESYFLDWVRPLLQYTEEDFIRVAGFDAVAYLRLFSFGVKLFTILSIFNLLVVLPVNLTDDRVDILERIESGDISGKELERLQEQDSTLTNDTSVQVKDVEDDETVTYKIGSFDKLSMTNINPGSNRLWAHLLSIWFITIVTLRLLWQYHQKAVELRIRFLATAENSAETRTVLVSDVPGLRYGSPLDRLMRSSLFKFLPKKMRKRVEESIELLFSVATKGMSQMTDISTQLARNLADQLQGSSKAPSMNRLRNKRCIRNAREAEALNIRLTSCEVKTIKPEEVTDMDPISWVTSKLQNQMPLEKVVELQFRGVYPDGLVKCANIVYDTSALEKLLKDYTKTIERLTDLIDHYTTKIKEGVIDVEIKKKRVVPLVEGKWAVEMYGAKPTEVDLLIYYADKLKFLKMQLLKEQNDVPHEQVPAAFVTFNTRWAQAVASTAFHHHFTTMWNVKAAPHPDELIWQNLKFRGWERTVRLFVTWAEFALICIFFFVPVAVVQGLIQMDRLERYPVIGSVVTFPLINGLLKGILPNLALKLFLAVMPAVLKKMSLQQGLISLSEIDFEVVRKYFIFQTITVFFFSFITGTFLSQIQELRDNPSSIRDILGVAAPQAATFFISYILYTGLFEGGISFLNLTNLAKVWLMSRFAGTERAKARIWKNQTIEYGVEVPSHTLTILFGLAFSVVNPIILPVALLYFLAMKLTWTYNMMYIYSEEYQSGGKLWDYVFEQVIVGLIITQSMMMGLFAIKRFPYSALLIPLPIVTLLFRTIVHRLYDKPLKIQSLRAAHDLDVMDQEQAAEQEVQEVDDGHDKYKHPSFLIDWDEMESLVNDAENLDQIVKGLNGKLTKTGYLPTSKS